MPIPNPVSWLKRICRSCLIVLLLLLLIGLLSCAALGWGIQKAFGAGPPGTDVLLLIDQSQSLWELGRVGSDPEMRRMEAAQLLIHYLGVDDLSRRYRLGVIFFGTQARPVVPLTPLDEAARKEMERAIQDPAPMGWTDINAALEMAQEMLLAGKSVHDARPVIILMTDGKPQTEAMKDSPQVKREYLARLEGLVKGLAGRGVTVHAVLLRNAATDADSDIQRLYRPLWTRLARSSALIHFHEVGATDDLLGLYQRIAAHLQGVQTREARARKAVSGQLREDIEVEPSLAAVTFLIHKSNPALRVRLFRPDGTSVKQGDSDVRHIERGHRFEVWSLERPMPGGWTLRAEGKGEVSVWKTVRPLPPTPTPLPTSTPTLTVTPTVIPTPICISVPALSILSPLEGRKYRSGQSIPVAVRVKGPLEGAEIQARLEGGGGVRSVPLKEAEGRSWTGEMEGLSEGRYTLTLLFKGKAAGVLLEGEERVSFRVMGRRKLWPFLLLSAACLILLAGGWSWRWKRQGYFPEGELRVVRGPDDEVGKGWDLGGFRKRAILLGSGGRCEIRLRGDGVPSQALRLTARPGQKGVETLVTPLDDAVAVNGRTLRAEAVLRDGDTISFGPYIIRYENLRQRARSRLWQGRRATPDDLRGRVPLRGPVRR
ncbi:MAG TPA: VWA domain-containing protein [Anaerolineae bacterium]|nr:VWA domain-containing protein [Anaerolineae bacterium]